MEGNLKQKLEEHLVFLMENINPSPFLWARLRQASVITEAKEERLKVCTVVKSAFLIGQCLVFYEMQ